MSIEQFPVNPKASSNVKWARYDPVGARAEIDFKDKDGNYASTYEYGSDSRPFTRQDWESFRSATKPGEYFASSIRGRFPYRKLNHETEPKPPAAEQERLF